MTAPAQLAALQQWLLATITDTANIDAATACNRVSASRRLAACQRLGVYQHAYFARLIDVLRDLLPCTRFAVGDDAFDELAASYIVRHPPDSYTLGRLADRWTTYLEQTRPAANWASFVVELSRLEQAIDRVFDGLGPEALWRFHVPHDADESLQLQLVPGCRLHEFSFPVSTYYSDWKTSRQPTWPRPQTEFVALWRRDFVVRRLVLTPIQHELLSAIERGAALGAALQTALRNHSAPNDLAAQVRGWFTTWSAAGLFAGHDSAHAV
jgi:hypothetical protein